MANIFDHQWRCNAFCEQEALHTKPTNLREATCLLLLLYCALNLEYAELAATTLHFPQRWTTFSACACLCGQCLLPHKGPRVQSHEDCFFFLPTPHPTFNQYTKELCTLSSCSTGRTRLLEHLFFDMQQDRTTVAHVRFAVRWFQPSKMAWEVKL